MPNDLVKTDTGETVEVEQVVILDDQLIDHLAQPDSSMTLYHERFKPEYLVKDEKFAIEVLKFVFEHIGEYGHAPSNEVVRDKFIKFQFAAPITNINYLIERFRERYKKQLIEQIVKSVGRLSRDDPDEAMRQGLADFYTLVNRTASRKDTVDNADWQQAIELYKTRVKEGAFNGVTYGWPEIDEVLGGYRNGLHLVLGRPKRYKSWILLKSAVEAYRTEERNVAFYSLELTHHEFYGRFICMMADVSWNRFHHGQLMTEDFRAIEKAMKETEEWEHKFTIMHPPMDQRTAPTMLQQAHELNAEVIYVDQLSFMDMAQSRRWEKNHEKIGYICEELKAAADYMPIIVAAQFNREAANLSEMADTAKIGLSDAIGQKADTLLGLYQNKEMRQSHFLQFGVVDSRNTDYASFHLHVNLNDGCDFDYNGRAVE